MNGIIFKGFCLVSITACDLSSTAPLVHFYQSCDVNTLLLVSWGWRLHSPGGRGSGSGLSSYSVWPMGREGGEEARTQGSLGRILRAGGSLSAGAALSFLLPPPLTWALPDASHAPWNPPREPALSQLLTLLRGLRCPRSVILAWSYWKQPEGLTSAPPGISYRCHFMGPTADLRNRNLEWGPDPQKICVHAKASEETLS